MGIFHINFLDDFALKLFNTVGTHVIVQLGFLSDSRIATMCFEAVSECLNRGTDVLITSD